MSRKKHSAMPKLIQGVSWIGAAFMLLLAFGNLVSNGGLLSTFLLVLAAVILLPLRSLIQFKRKLKLKPGLVGLLFIGFFFAGILTSNNAIADDPAPTAEPAPIVMVTPTAKPSAPTSSPLSTALASEKELSAIDLNSANPETTPTPPISTPPPTPVPTSVPTPTPQPTTIALYADTAYYSNAWQIHIGDKVSTTLTVEPADSQVISSLYYYSNDERIAAVDAQGFVTGIAAGTTKIVVEGEGVSDYITVTVSEKQAAPVAAESQQSYETSGSDYVINTNTMKFHLPHCRYVKTIKDSNRWDYQGSRQEIIDMGYVPCKVCKP